MPSNIKTLYISNRELTQDKKYTYLASDVVSGSTSLKVQNTTGSTTNQILLIGEIGREQSEIIFTHSSTSPANSYIYLRSGLAFDHPQDTKVSLVDWDSCELSNSPTVSGSKTLLTISGGTGGTITLQVDQDETLYNDAQYTSGFYFTRFFNTTNAYYSDYSDPIPYAGFADNTVYAIKQRALDSVNEKISDVITDSFLNTSLWEARRELHNAPGKRPYRQRFNVDIGNVVGGMNKIAVPGDLHEPDSAKNLFGVRIGKEQNLYYKDKKVIDEYYRGIANSQLVRAYTPGDTSVFLGSSRDFDVTGSITAGTFTIGYSANSLTNGSLFVSTAGESQAPVDTEVWQNAALGLPSYFTVMRLETAGTSYIVFERPIDNTYANQNIYSDYYRTLVEYDSDADVLDEPPGVIDGFMHYLAYKIKKKKNQGLISKDDSDFIEWQRAKITSLANELTNTDVRMEPDVPSWDAY